MQAENPELASYLENDLGWDLPVDPTADPSLRPHGHRDIKAKTPTATSGFYTTVAGMQLARENHAGNEGTGKKPEPAER